MAVTDFYTDGFTIESRSTAPGYGGNTWATVGSYSGFMQPLTGNEVFKFGKSAGDVTHRFYTGLSTSVEQGYRITWQGQKYEVIYSDQPTGIAGRSSHKEILCKLILKDG
jgi:SPP1 family predicted phage head-tail adaptor